MKKIEIFLKNIFLKLLVLFNPVKKQPELPVFNSNSNLLFIRLNRIGDALITTPLIHEIKKNLGCKIYVLADKKNHFIFRNNPDVEEVIIYQKGLTGFLSINEIIKDKSIDAVIDLHDDVSTTVSFLIAIARIKYKFGLRKSNSVLYTNVVDKIDTSTNHVVDRILKLSELFKINLNNKEVSIQYYPTDVEKKIAKDQIIKMNPDNKFLIGINISAGSEARFWGIQNFQKLISKISKYDARVIILSSEKDIQYAAAITNEENIYPVTNSFGIFAAAILNLDFLITPDTSIVHIASIKKIPVFGLYVRYNTTDMVWSPYNTDFEYIETKEPTLKNITLEQVLEKLEPFLERYINVKKHS